MSNNCSNMNHGRLNAPVSFCPTCGKSVNSALSKRCDNEKHATRRKARSFFCCDCGIKLVTAR